MNEKPRLSFWQIWNMSFGFFGIQVGFVLQLSFMSAIYAKLGAKTHDIPILWLAAPLTGLIIQPIIGAMSDRTWTRLGRRRPYFLFGALTSATVLFFMPDSPALWFAVLGLWLMDTCFNISMEPFRAFVGDKLPASQRTLGFITQSFFIGIGGTIASFMPTILTKFGIEGNASNGIPLNIYWAFKIGAALFVLAILWTVITSKEDPPEDMEAFLAEKKKNKGPLLELHITWLISGLILGALIAYSRGLLVENHVSIWHPIAGGAIGAAIATILSQREVASALREMPTTMKRLAFVQFFTWLGLFCMWLMFSHATAQQIYGTTDSSSAAFDKGVTFGGATMAWYSIVCFSVAFFLTPLAKLIGRRALHSLALCCGAAGLIGTGFIHDQFMWQLTMVGVGIAWASILSMPYAMLSTSIPSNRMGVYMGIFNFFIVIPEIIAAVGLEPIMKKFFSNDPVKVLMLGGISMFIAALLCFAVGKEAEEGA